MVILDTPYRLVGLSGADPVSGEHYPETEGGRWGIGGRSAWARLAYADGRTVFTVARCDEEPGDTFVPASRTYAVGCLSSVLQSRGRPGRMIAVHGTTETAVLTVDDVDVEYPALRAYAQGSYWWDARARLAWLIAGLRRRPGTLPYRQAVPMGPYEALAVHLDDDRVIAVTQPTEMPVPALRTYAPKAPGQPARGGSPARAGS
ncbi:hypothetical protein [Streptomyces alanosinicus]|uniref:Uncharacterized protein n=1 Tax=Streptomyces alanosinicus TaxID=68171 RepID=A0A918YJZ2_9ACTN|nr:hypothetical protein [Streptomyces alanosinicus]GHE06564.1 hypothetical protein GCM10010339_47600 [Streptomyces alanosinicus]